HRHVLVEEDRLIERFGPGLRERGFGEDRFVALARVPGGELDPNVRELTFEDVRALRDVVVAEQMVPSEPTVIAQLVEASALSVEAGGRWLVLFEDGSPAAHCVVYSHLGLAQIEDVATLAAYRRRGCARRLIEH